MLNFRLKISLLSLVLLSACSIQSIVADRLSSALESGVTGQDDPQLVREGLASYLLLLEGFIAESDGDQPALYAAAAQLYAGYAGLLEDSERAGRLALKARDYGRLAACPELVDLCQSMLAKLDDMLPALNAVGADKLDALYILASNWAGWIQLNTGDWNAVADIPKVEALMKHIVSLDNQFEQGWPQLYLGVLNSILPPAYGGKPELARTYFEQALEHSFENNLMVHVLFAQFYARLVFDQELHDQLLNQALTKDPQVDDLRLVNTLAKTLAQQLLEDGRDYF